MELKIEKGVPPPTETGLPAVLPAMEPGDSVLVTGYSDRSISPILARFQRVHPGTKFATRKVEGGRRVWRIA